MLILMIVIWKVVVFVIKQSDKCTFLRSSPCDFRTIYRVHRALFDDKDGDGDELVNL